MSEIPAVNFNVNKLSSVIKGQCNAPVLTLHVLPANVQSYQYPKINSVVLALLVQA